MPSNEFSADCEEYWVKGPGRAGNNKTRLLVQSETYHNTLTMDLLYQWDIQQHVDGDEYRVIAVANKVVQVARRLGDNGDRSYRWVGVSNAGPDIRNIVKRATLLLTDGVPSRTIIGWDVIVDANGKPYILEGNACPGVNLATANRIVNAVIGYEGM